MAIRCGGCGNFISPEITHCPICGDTARNPRSPVSGEPEKAHRSIYDLWDHFWHVGGGGSTLSRHEAVWMRVLIGIMTLILGVTLFLIK